MNNPFIPNTNTNSVPWGESPTAAPTGVPMPGNVSSADQTFEVDFSTAQDRSYTVPDGSYKAKCIDVSQEVSKSGNPMFVWQFELVGGQYAGKQFKSWTAVTPAAMWKVAETVVALGVGQNGQVVKFKRSDVIGKLCGLVMEQDEYNGKMVSRVARVISLQELAGAQG